MKYTEFLPEPFLRADVQCLWLGGETGNRLVIPDGCLDIIFQVRDGSIVSSLLVGAMTRHFWVPQQNTDYVGIRFHPGCARRFFEFPIASITDKILPLESVWGRGVKEVEQRLMELPTWQDRMKLAQHWLWERKLGTIPSFSYFAWAWNQSPQLSVETIAASVGVTRQHLRRIFLEHSGLTPKQFIQISRVHQAARIGPARLNTLELGFYDQSHLIHQFKKYTGLTPREYFQVTQRNYL
ncbi:MAG: DUF6597 domain-containing transcriptional factor [Bdellovibrionales bacterium]